MAIEVDGLTTKVFNDCVRRPSSFGFLQRQAYSEVPPRVEYRLTERGEHFVLIIDAVDELQRELVAESEGDASGKLGLATLR